MNYLSQGGLFPGRLLDENNTSSGRRIKGPMKNRTIKMTCIVIIVELFNMNLKKHIIIFYKLIYSEIIRI